MPFEFDERNLLCARVQDATLAEIEEQFGRMQGTDRRIRLFAKLKDYLEALGRTGWAC